MQRNTQLHTHALQYNRVCSFATVQTSDVAHLQLQPNLIAVTQRNQSTSNSSWQLFLYAYRYKGYVTASFASRSERSASDLAFTTAAN